MKQPFILLVLLAFMSSCKKDEPSGEPQPVSNRIRFDAPAVGQISCYLNLSGEMYYSGEYDNFQYFDDTLQVEIVAKDANGYKVKETLHYVGDVHEWLNWDKDSIFYYYLRVSGDTLRMSPVNTPFMSSRIFAYGLSEQGLPLKKIISPKVEILGWKTSLNYCECRQQGYAKDYTLFGKTYDHLNVLVENSAMAWDGSGMTYVFSKGSGIVRFSTYGWWTQSGYGWDLLPEN